MLRSWQGRELLVSSAHAKISTLAPGPSTDSAPRAACGRLDPRCRTPLPQGEGVHSPIR
ncbi:protein of unknown function [Micropruina glycogenica]|uniref:Uncharacterized protein n=1 Tax=Micropruina glycogenica TaxID=75385 RepID=A0A2N9JFK7_9ACTN|nr:protein of unknown function [Micropruina glycogenica]